MSAETTAARIERLLRDGLTPIRFELHDDTVLHAGHAGAAAGGGYYRVLIVSAAFEGLSRIEQHRLVHETLGPMIGAEIHALSLRTLTPGESRT